MDAARLAAELDLLRTRFPDIEHREHGGEQWVRIPAYSVPVGWSHRTVEIAFRIPAEPGQQPYAFFARPALALLTGAAPTNYTATATTPWGTDFAQFSWSPLEAWVPKTDLRAGANMLNFAASFADRLAELS